MTAGNTLHPKDSNRVWRQDFSREVNQANSLLEYTDFSKLYEKLRKKTPPDKPILVLFADADNLKQVNDTFGHELGDALIAEIATILNDNLPSGSIICRKGGDEFIACTAVKNFETAERVATGITCMLNNRRFLLSHEVLLSCSVGASISVNYECSLHTQLKNADTAMYLAKSSGKGQLRVFDEHACSKLLMVQELAKVFFSELKTKRLSFCFQPIYRMSNRQIVGAEALIRWHHEKYGMICPEIIVEIAGKSGRMRELGDFILSEACSAAIHWPLDTFVSVNFSPSDFLRADFADFVLSELRAVGLDASRLRIEITESEKMLLTDDVFSNLSKLRQNGVSVGIDDFGTGNSTMANIDKVPVDFVKIDKSLVSDCHQRKSSKIFINAISKVSRHLKLEVIAEGVETVQDYAILRGLGVIFAQGFYFHRPISPERMLNLFSVPITDFLWTKDNLYQPDLSD